MRTKLTEVIKKKHRTASILLRCQAVFWVISKNIMNILICSGVILSTWLCIISEVTFGCSC
ncbi:hypothetical protein DVW01_02375 [Enterococcus faecium]|nr:hypothetical protein DMB17_09755 [Enterococcus faecium]RCF82361.1 hypothetical protein B1172_12175 [Enterococcus faecium]RCF87825.1 hypothetical protein B1142_07960 [Enterococcus faecium]RCF96546.1 hypothetical protein B1141_00105 [Enterococcus faecium]RCG05725.1 hypothetical protein B1144_02465 [Enterococcus faecium]